MTKFFSNLKKEVVGISDRLKIDFPRTAYIIKVVLWIVVCSSLEAQAVIRFKYLLLSQSKIAFGDCNAAVVE